MDELLKFSALIQSFKAVRRKVVLAKESREENDAEHSFDLALTAWYIATVERLPLDMELVFKYALVHDLVEVYAGDTPAVQKGGEYDEQRNSKEKREAEAADRLQKEFPEFPEMHDLILGYDARQNEESRFVYALDKIIPLLSVYLDGGYSWNLHNIQLEDLIENKKDKIAQSAPIKKYWDLIIERLKKEREKFFK